MLILVIVPAFLLAQAPALRLFDLTTPISSSNTPRDILGPPSISIPSVPGPGGHNSQMLGTVVLPLIIQLTSVQRTETELVAEISIANDSPKPFYLPVARDSNHLSLQPGNTGRRQFLFQLAFHFPGETDIVTLGEITEGSQSLPSSMQEISPGGTVKVRYRVPLLLDRWIAKGIGIVDVQADCVERIIDNDRYNISDQSQTLRSINTVAVILK